MYKNHVATYQFFLKIDQNTMKFLKKIENIKKFVKYCERL